MQIVYISNRPTIFAETLQHVALFMEFIDRVLVCVPDHQRAEFESTSSKLPISVVGESEILSDTELATLHRLDHQRRNYLLRTQLAKSGSVDDQFIMSDDDARPLKPISVETFIEGGRYRRYFFYDLAHWDNNQTEFDAGQIATYAILNYENLPHLSYASHMPQVIDRSMFIEATDFFAGHQQNHPLCEWSTYFNFAVNQHPEKFHYAEAYITLCWPEHPLAWKTYVHQAGHVFENHTPSLYKKRVFSQPSLRSSPLEIEDQIQLNITKIISWRKYVISSINPEQSKGILKYLRPTVWRNKLLKPLRFK